MHKKSYFNLMKSMSLLILLTNSNIGTEDKDKSPSHLPIRGLSLMDPPERVMQLFAYEAFIKGPQSSGGSAISRRNPLIAPSTSPSSTQSAALAMAMNQNRLAAAASPVPVPNVSSIQSFSSRKVKASPPPVSGSASISTSTPALVSKPASVRASALISVPTPALAAAPKISASSATTPVQALSPSPVLTPAPHLNPIPVPIPVRTSALAPTSVPAPDSTASPAPLRMVIRVAAGARLTSPSVAPSPFLPQQGLGFTASSLNVGGATQHSFEPEEQLGKPINMFQEFLYAALDDSDSDFDSEGEEIEEPLQDMISQTTFYDNYSDSDFLSWPYSDQESNSAEEWEEVPSPLEEGFELVAPPPAITSENKAYEALRDLLQKNLKPTSQESNIDKNPKGPIVAQLRTQNLVSVFCRG